MKQIILHANNAWQSFIKEDYGTCRRDLETLLTTLDKQIKDDREYFERYMVQIECDPFCRTCDGKGYIGIVRPPKKKKDEEEMPLLQLCHCAAMKETTQVKILSLIIELQSKIEQHERRLLEENQVMFRHTFFGGIKMWWLRRKMEEQKIRKQTKQWCLAGYEALLKLTRRRKHAESSAEEVHQPAGKD